MNSRSSAPIGSGGHSVGCESTISCHQTSRPSCIVTPSCAVRRSTRQRSIDGVSAIAASAISFSGTTLPRRHAPSPVMSTLHSASLIRSRSESEVNPPNTTECAAPSRAHASIATGSSGTIPR